MKCISPITLKIANPRNKDGKAIVPCGKCINCLINRRESWIARLIEEHKIKPALFITLTYSDENLTFASTNPTVVKRDVQLFFKRFRKSFKETFKYYLVAEYGTKTRRPHYHFIIFSDFFSADVADTILNAWQLGNITCEPLNMARLVYTTKYHVNRGSYPSGTSPPFTLMSKGLGIDYVEKMRSFHNGKVENLYYPMYNYKKPLPRYYKSKLYSKKELNRVPIPVDDIDKQMEEYYRTNKFNFFAYLELQNRFKEENHREKVNKTLKL